MRFRWHPIRERDADGRLAAAGVQWSERREFVLNVHIVLTTVALMGAMFAAFLHVVQGHGPELALIFLTAAILIACSARIMPGTTRALIFHRDGRTTAPHGFARYRRRYREVAGSNGDFVSIEARGRGTNSNVVMFSRWGTVVYAGGRLHHDEAHCVAVQLTLALAELRESAANEAAGTSGTRPRAEAVID